MLARLTNIQVVCTQFRMFWQKYKMIYQRILHVQGVLASKRLKGIAQPACPMCHKYIFQLAKIFSRKMTMPRFEPWTFWVKKLRMENVMSFFGYDLLMGHTGSANILANINPYIPPRSLRPRNFLSLSFHRTTTLFGSVRRMLLAFNNFAEHCDSNVSLEKFRTNVKSGSTDI